MNDGERLKNLAKYALSMMAALTLPERKQQMSSMEVVGSLLNLGRPPVLSMVIVPTVIMRD